MKENQLFTRYEFKYFLNNKISNQIENEAKHFMSYDNFAVNIPDNRYFVRSLYYENNSFSNFFEKVDGIKSRRKFRIRTYGNSLKNNLPIFLEIKGRHLERTFKKRTSIDSKYIELFLNSEKNSKLLEIYPNNIIINDFVFDSIKKKIKPCVLIDYKRRPYINNFGLYFRLTFDSIIVSSKSKILFSNENKSTPLQCRSGYTILEVKFDRSIPAWFHRIIQSYNLTRRSISKFVLGVCTCKLEHETSE